MTDESTNETTSPGPQRSWAQETGWPTGDPTPSWADPGGWEETSDEAAYDAWLDAQDADLVGEPDLEEEPAGAEPEADVDQEQQQEQEQEEPAPEPVAEPEAPAAQDEPSVVPVTRSAAPIVAPLVVLVVLLAVLTGLLGAMSVGTRGGGDVGHARRDALAAARKAARLVFSYDYRHLDKDFAAGKAVTTGTFAADYARSTSKLVDDVAARYKAVVVADVSDAAVVTAGKNRVVTLVFLNQRSTSSLAAGQKITQSRITMVLVRKKGRWLVSEVSAF